ncbi:MAG: mechanosensitive ion channel [Planctomycetes bacterium]|nr:mechanosensitive ion channel [Planctomycetota bacterium]
MDTSTLPLAGDAPTAAAHSVSSAGWLDPAIGLGIVLAAAVALWLLARLAVLPLVAYVTGRAFSRWGAALAQHRVLHRLVWLAPFVGAYQGLHFVSGLPPAVGLFLAKSLMAAMVVVGVATAGAGLGAINHVYNQLAVARGRPIKGFLQVAKILLYGFGLIVVIATLMDQEVGYFITGMGAMTAVLLLVFRDTLLSLVAGIQLTNGGLIRVGDWISMPQFGADGTVVDIALNSVLVQNFDNTITPIPTHKFLDNAFTNWRGMQDAGVRRIMRTLHLHQGSIRFCDDALFERLRRIQILRPYLDERGKEIDQWNAAHAIDGACAVNGRRMTNLGSFRAYCLAYLRRHPGIRQDAMLMVRQLEPTPAGLPLQLYVFAATTDWATYEALQADIFDHLLAAVTEFDLHVFQHPSGYDLRGLAQAPRPLVAQGTP